MSIYPSIIALTIVTLWLPYGISVPGFGWDPHLKGSTCVDPGYFVNPHDCTRFFRCVDHSTSEGPLLIRYDFDCPHGTVFDEGAKVCIHARDGICRGWGSPLGWGVPPFKKGWGWPGPLDGWSKPGWSAPKGRKPLPKGGWKGAPVQLAAEDDDEGSSWAWGQPSNSFWSFTPGSSYVVVYDNRGRDQKRSVELP
ncbi:uncharacterized protein LOC110863074 [Folsomia candida]|uniref:Putative endochitinase n=1 Tax=Folsomia candida TaxID=158441 RepID=A0A226F3K5_FOLCA|nr:uncharacterized protein LOC110863074 [Folsomia candida]OXA64375.1 putative endochitinase [Folsomia candida]